MAVSFRQESHVVGSGTSPTLAEPAGTSPNDVLVALSVVAAASTVLTAPAGWTVLLSGSASTVFKYNLAVIWRGASAPALGWTVTGTVYREVHILAFSGAMLPVDVTVDGGTVAGSSVIDGPAATPAANDSMVVAGGANWAGSNATGWVTPANYSFRTNNAAGNDAAMVSRLLVGGAGVSENPGTITGSSTTGQAWQFTLVLPPIKPIRPPVTRLQAISRSSVF